uniref:Uncharacterized protein n=1 Tax=Cacopsylla melanoneura TaxID=428564 RepID=A0A8D8SSD5_9HEMI
MHHSVPSPRLKTSSSTSLMHAVRLRETDVNLCRRRARSMFYETSSKCTVYKRNFLTYFWLFFNLLWFKSTNRSSGFISVNSFENERTMNGKMPLLKRLLA